MEQRAGISNELSPAIFFLLFIVVSFFGGAYVQEHLNRIWDRATSSSPPPRPPIPPMPA